MHKQLQYSAVLKCTFFLVEMTKHRKGLTFQAQQKNEAYTLNKGLPVDKDAPCFETLYLVLN